MAGRHNEQCSMFVMGSGLPEGSGVFVQAAWCGPKLVHISIGSTLAVRTEPRDGVGAMAPSTAISSASHTVQGRYGECVRCLIATVTFSGPSEPGV